MWLGRADGTGKSGRRRGGKRIAWQGLVRRGEAPVWLSEGSGGERCGVASESSEGLGARGLGGSGASGVAGEPSEWLSEGSGGEWCGVAQALIRLPMPSSLNSSSNREC